MMKNTDWNEQFNIGVDSIDKAHRKLFSIVRRLIYLSDNENHGKWACAEGIKYFKNYAVRHFAQEEAYMLSIGYNGYEMHKRLHDNLRYQTLPALEKDLTASDYSEESIHHFIGICLGWLTAHIMIEDRAITGKISNKWKKDPAGKDMKALEDAIACTMEEIFKLQIDIVSQHYSGENFGENLIIRLTYLTPEGQSVRVFLVLEESLVLHTVSSMLDMQLMKVDRLVVNAAKELSGQLTGEIGTYFPSSSQFKPAGCHIITMEQLQQEFEDGYPFYSLLFDTGKGYFAFCIKK